MKFLSRINASVLFHFSRGIKIHSFENLDQFNKSSIREISSALKNKERILIEDQPEFIVDGNCYVCDAESGFQVDFMYSGDGERGIPNWRERMICPGCNLNNRMRAVVHLLESLGKAEAEDDIYVTEQTTYLYLELKERYANLCGSEFLGPQFDAGVVNESGIRHEDMTALSFDDECFDHILSFDVLEHIPDYQRALRECSRCLRMGGCLFLTAPFRMDSFDSITRAGFDDKGELVHYLPAEYHGDPTNPDEGILCYYHFGWDILEALKSVEFGRCFVNLYWSRQFGYLGGYQVIITAFKGKTESSAKRNPRR